LSGRSAKVESCENLFLKDSRSFCRLRAVASSDP